jgi:hypothetical protein
VGKPEGKRPLGRPRRRWVNNIKLDLRAIEWDGMDWIELAQDRDQWRVLVNMVMNHHNHPGQATIAQSVAAVSSGPSWTPPPTKRIFKKLFMRQRTV